jgi:hypothetical protein
MIIVVNYISGALLNVIAVYLDYEENLPVFSINNMRSKR